MSVENCTLAFSSMYICQILINRTEKPIGKITSGSLPNELSVKTEFYKIRFVFGRGSLKEIHVFTREYST